MILLSFFDVTINSISLLDIIVVMGMVVDDATAEVAKDIPLVVIAVLTGSLIYTAQSYFTYFFKILKPNLNKRMKAGKSFTNFYFEKETSRPPVGKDVNTGKRRKKNIIREEMTFIL